MLKKMLYASLLVLAAFGFSVFAQEKTVVNNTKAKTMLLGKHKVSLQWISWDYFGAATVTNKKGVFYLKGGQNQRGKGSDYLTIDGVITEIDAKEFKFDGTIITQISHINNGEPCMRTGELTFKISGKRKYWRMQEIDNPCDVAADYVDIYLR